MSIVPDRVLGGRTALSMTCLTCADEATLLQHLHSAVEASSIHEPVLVRMLAPRGRHDTLGPPVDTVLPERWPELLTQLNLPEGIVDESGLPVATFVGDALAAAAEAASSAATVAALLDAQARLAAVASGAQSHGNVSPLVAACCALVVALAYTAAAFVASVEQGSCNFWNTNSQPCRHSCRECAHAPCRYRLGVLCDIYGLRISCHRSGAGRSGPQRRRRRASAALGLDGRAASSLAPRGAGCARLGAGVCAPRNTPLSAPDARCPRHCAPRRPRGRSLGARRWRRRHRCAAAAAGT